MANQVVAGLVGAALGVCMTTAIALSVRPKNPPGCPTCPKPPSCPTCPQPQPQPQPPPAVVDAGVAEADIDAGGDLGDLTCSLDEVGCLLADRPPPCCSMYGNRHVTPAPTGLTAQQVRDTIGRLRGRIARCAEESDQHGKFKAQVKVNPDGSVSTVLIRGAPDDALAQCVGAIMRSARFPRTDLGGSFTYPFVF